MVADNKTTCWILYVCCVGHLMLFINENQCILGHIQHTSDSFVAQNVQ